MRCAARAPTLLSLLFTLLHHTIASPIPDPIPQITCDTSSGASACGNICCAANQKCSFEGQCAPASNSGSGSTNPQGTWQYFTSTWIETGLVTRTTVYSSFIPSATAVNPSASRPPSTTWNPPSLTSSIRNPSGSGGSSGGFIATISNGATFTPPTRPTQSFNGGVIGGDTSGSKILVPTVTGTNTYLVPVPTGSLGFGGVVGGNSSGSGLTGAQIGGIVGGVLGALFLIALILLCCCLKKGFRGFFGWLNSFGGRRHAETVVVQESHGHGSHHHHGGAATAAGAGAGAGFLAGMFGRRPRQKVTTTTTHVHEHHSIHDHHGASGAAGSHHYGSTHHGHGGGLGVGAVSGVSGGHHGSGGAHHGSGGLAALIGGAAAGFASMFSSRRRTRVSEKYDTSGESYSDTDFTTESPSETTSDSSSSSSSSSSSESTSSSDR